MCKVSPAKILRSVKRMTNYNEKRGLKNILPALPIPLLSKEILVPSITMLSLSAPTCLSISPAKRNLSICSQFPSEVVPGLINEDEQTISTYIDGFRHETVFICKLCNSDHFRSTPSIKKHQREVHKIIVRPILNYPFEPTFECLS